MLENVLCMIVSLCLEKHTWEITESGELSEFHCYLQYHCLNLCGYGLGIYLDNLRSIDLLLNMVDISNGEFTTQPPEH